MGGKVRRYVGWGLTILLGLLFIASSAGKFSGAEPVVEGFRKAGLESKLTLIGAGELASALLFLIPWTFSLGVLLLSGYMGGAIVTHMTQGEPYVVQSVILLVIWLTAFLRYPEMFQSFWGRPKAAAGVTEV